MSTKKQIVSALLFSAPMLLGITAVKADENIKTGHIDVYVDNSSLKNAITYATSAGVKTDYQASEPIYVDTQTDLNTKVAEIRKYYTDKSAEIKTVADNYTTALANAKAEQKRYDEEAQRANAQMSALQANATLNGKTVVSESKEFVSEDDVNRDTANIQNAIRANQTLNEIEQGINNFALQQGAMTLFDTQAAQGNITVRREIVDISDPSQIAGYLTRINNSYQELQTFVNQTTANNGQITNKPTFTLYDLRPATSTQTAAAQPVTIYNYRAKKATEPTVPVVNYTYYDLRARTNLDREAVNRDGEHIDELVKASSNGQKVVQAIKNQIVGINTINEPLPANRYERFHDITTTLSWTGNVDVQSLLTHINPDQWNYTYDDIANRVTLSATAAYLVDINKQQAANHNGEVGTSVNNEFRYQSPAVFVKLLDDDSTYQFFTETIVNHEYRVQGSPITVRTESADPTKHNYNSKLVQIDGKPVLPGSVNNYEVVLDNDQYLGINIDRQMQEEGQWLIDVYPSDAVELTGPFVARDKETGEILLRSAFAPGATSGTFENLMGGSNLTAVWYHITNDNKPEALKDVDLEGKSAIAIRLYGYDNVYYKNYVEKGKSVGFTLPMTTKKIDNTPDKRGGTYNGNTYTNVAYQIDFGNLYKTNEVTNHAPLLDPRKDAVLSFANLTTLDIDKNEAATIERGQHYFYRGSSSTLPAGLSEEIYEVGAIDEMPLGAEYQGNYILENGTPFYFKQGTTLYNRYIKNGGVMPANTQIEKHATVTVERNVSRSINTPTQTVNGADDVVTRVRIDFDPEFLAQIDWSKTQFQYDWFLEVKGLVDSGTLTNYYQEIINGMAYDSQEVVTRHVKNEVDILKEQLAKLDQKVDKNHEEFTEFKKETVSALAIIVQSVENNRLAIAANKKAVEDLDTKVNVINTNLNNKIDAVKEEVVEKIEIVEETVNERIDKVIEDTSATFLSFAEIISNIVDKIEENKKEADAKIETVAEVVLSNTSAINNLIKALATTNTALAETKDQLAAKTEQKLAEVTIYDKTITTPAQAVDYILNATKVAPGAIKSVDTDANGRFVVRYNASETAINSSPVKIPEATTVRTQVKTYDFRGATTEEQAIDETLKLGHARNNILGVVKTATGYRVTVQTALA